MSSFNRHVLTYNNQDILFKIIIEMNHEPALWVWTRRGNTFIFGSAWARESVSSLESGAETSEELQLIKKKTRNINLAIRVLQAPTVFVFFLQTWQNAFPNSWRPLAVVLQKQVEAKEAQVCGFRLPQEKGRWVSCVWKEPVPFHVSPAWYLRN